MNRKTFVVALGAALLGGCFVSPLQAQMQAAPGGPKYTSPKAAASVKLSDAAITITYCQPSMHGRTIFGGLVPYNKVWRTGANAATTLVTTGNLMIGDLKVPAGTYTLYSLPTEQGWKLIVNKQTGQWGTEYNEGQDLGRTEMKVGSAGSPAETFSISFEGTSGDKTEMHLKWADKDASVPVMAAK